MVRVNDEVLPPGTASLGASQAEERETAPARVGAPGWKVIAGAATPQSMPIGGDAWSSMGSTFAARPSKMKGIEAAMRDYAAKHPEIRLSIEVEREGGMLSSRKVTFTISGASSEAQTAALQFLRTLR